MRIAQYGNAQDGGVGDHLLGFVMKDFDLEDGSRQGRMTQSSLYLNENG